MRAKRKALRRHSRVIQVLEKFWDAFDVRDDDVISERQYELVYLLIGKSLFVDFEKEYCDIMMYWVGLLISVV